MSLRIPDRARPWRPSDSDRPPPQSIEAEMGVLGSILLDNAVADDVLLLLRPSDFYRDTHQTIFQAISDLLKRGEPADAVTLADELIRRDLFREVGGDDMLRSIVDSVPHAANAAYYAGIVRERAIARELIDEASEILRTCYRQEDDVYCLLADAERRIFAVGDRGQSSRIVGIGDAIEDGMQRLAAREDGRVIGLTTGYSDLDELTGGFKRGEMTVLAARPSMGKTALALEFAVRVAEKEPALIVSLEMGQHSLADRLIASQARVDSYRFERPWRLSPEDREALAGAAANLSALPIELDFSPARDVAGIASVARRMKRRRGLGLIAVDYLQLLTPESRRGMSRDQEVARLSKGLKDLARDLGVPVLVLSQLNRKVEERPDKRPVMSDLRDSGAIEQDADVVLLLYRPEYYDPDDRPGVAILDVAKNRNGATGRVEFAFVKQHTRFDAIARDAAGTS